jgi:hypothetical protein
MKFVLVFLTYPRDYSNITYQLLSNTFNSLKNNNGLDLSTIKIIVIGDDYDNMAETLSPIFSGYDCDYYNINLNDAVRNKKLNKKICWKQACTRSIIYAFEKSLEYKYDYVFLSSDDDLYTNDKINISTQYIHKYNYPDFVFSLARHVNKQILPPQYDNINLLNNFPQNSKVIQSGTLYKLQNTQFIYQCIQIMKNCNNHLLDYIKNNNLPVNDNDVPVNDGYLWDQLNPLFKNNTFSSLLIPIVLTFHDTEQTITQYCHLK